MEQLRVPKHRARYSVVSYCDHPYNKMEDIDWPTIEEAAGRGFDTQSREEIFQAARRFFSAHGWSKNQADLASVDSALDLALSLERPLQSIIESLEEIRFDGETPIGLSQPNTLVFETVDVLFEGSLSDFHDSAKTFIDSIRRQKSAVLQAKSNDPVLDGLVSYFTFVCADSKVSTAKSKNAQSFSRWGLNVNYSANRFSELTDRLLSINVPLSKKKQAWQRMLSNVKRDK